MAKLRMTVVARVKPGRMADFIKEQQGWKDQLGSMPGTPAYSTYMIQAGSPQEGGFNICASTLEFGSSAKYGEFMDAMSPDSMAALTDQGNDPSSAADIVNVIVSHALVE